MKVKLIKFLDKVGGCDWLENDDLTIGNTYEVVGEGSEPGSVAIYDDSNEQNELYIGEFEIVK